MMTTTMIEDLVDAEGEAREAEVVEVEEQDLL
jgi:hypothetical protein